MVRLSRHGPWALGGRCRLRQPSHPAGRRNLQAKNFCDFFDLTAASRVVTRKSAKPTVGALTYLQSWPILLIGES